MIAQFSISDGNTQISCAAIGKLRTLMPSDVPVFAENVVLQIEVGKSQINWIKNKPILILKTPPKLIANCKKVIGQPKQFIDLQSIDTAREVDLKIPATTIVDWDDSIEELSSIMMNCSL